MARYRYNTSDDALPFRINGCGLRCSRTAQLFSLFLENKAKLQKMWQNNKFSTHNMRIEQFK